MKRLIVLAMLVACKRPTGDRPDPTVVVTVPPPPSAIATTADPTATATAAPTVSPNAPSKEEAVALVQSTVPKWLTMLKAGKDEDFIDDAVVPEDMEKLLKGQTKGELVKDFKADKHDKVVKMLTTIQHETPTKVGQRGDRAMVRYEVRGEKDVNFVVYGGRVHIKN